MSQSKDLQKAPAPALVFLAFAGLYIIWGSTYLGILFALESFPPFLLVAFRFLISGSLLLTYCLIMREKLPSIKSTLIIGASGFLMLFIGNGALTWAEQYLPSGLAAIIISTLPLWFVVLDKKQWAYHFSNKIIIPGVLVGFAGVFMLFSGTGSVSISGNKMQVISFCILILSTICWAIGSMYSKYKPVEGSTTMKAAIQMLTAGILSLGVALVSNEQKGFEFSSISPKSFWALWYLIIMGSLVGYLSIRLRKKN